MLRVGAQMYTVREHTQTPEGFSESLGKIKDMGYKLVQVSAVGKDIPVEYIAKALKESGLSCTVTHISFDDLQNDFDAVVKKHDAWNCEYVGVGAMPASYRSEEGIYRFAEDAGKISERLKKAGKKFVYHNHSFEFAKYGEKRGMDILFENTPDTFQFELDMFWVQNAGADPIEWTRKVAGRMDIMHFKDMDMILDKNEHIMAPIGGGNMNWPGIVKALNETGVKYGFVEQDICRTDPFDCLKESLAYLNSIGVPV
jgi:sugar phosphate isomerase/epimerase